MPRRKLYHEGDLFLVPLDRRPGTFGLGLIARASRSAILGGFFFGPALDYVPDEAERSALAERLRPDDASHVGRFGDRGLQEARWPILGAYPAWADARERWMLPPFGHVDSVDSRRAFLRFYDPESLSFVAEEACSPEKAGSCFRDGLADAGFMEMRLTRLLAHSP